jgi:hypothetical protein
MSKSLEADSTVRIRMKDIHDVPCVVTDNTPSYWLSRAETHLE